jgi:Cft2 family RNA processing exonuclease
MKIIGSCTIWKMFYHEGFGTRKFPSCPLERRNKMNISILGGGSEVGASCLHIQIAGTNLLIDAGMRMHADDPMPALGMLENLGEPDVILVTHAHADHIGALPVIHSLYPKTAIYTMPPTADLMRVMLKDSYKILEQKSHQTNTLIPYTEDQVNGLLESLQLFPASGVLKIGSVTVTSYRAGHILGAVMFLIEGNGEQVLVTGDLSFKAGRTIPGAQVPTGIQPDVVVMESTYGNRMHTDRNTEEKRLANDIAEVISNGGFALIPAFALGRAQEVLLVLQDYMEKGLIPEFPIYVDGLVTPISRIYRNYPHFLKGPVAHRVRMNGDAFLTEGRCHAVSPKERNLILKGKPGCIVASSGMLIGGASSWYAERLISDEKNAIFLTGYQDEESPGRKLLNIADGIENQLELNGTVFPVKCQVGKYGLSAHADSNEMTRFIQSLRPTYTLLVHGDDEARTKLYSLIDPIYHPTLVENGESYSFEKRDSGKGVKGKRPYRPLPSDDKLREKIGSLLLYRSENGPIFKLAICTGINIKSNILFCQTLNGKQVKLSLDQVVETIGKWNRSLDEVRDAADQVFMFSRPYLEKIDWSILPNGPITLGTIFQGLGIDSIKEQLAISLVLQGLPDKARSKDDQDVSLYKIDAAVKEQLRTLDLQYQGNKVNPTLAMEIVRDFMADSPHFIRCGVDGLGTSQERVTIYFDFPDAVTEKEREGITREIFQATGWKVSFSDSVRQDLLQARLAKLVGGSFGTPSIHLHERKVVLSTVETLNASAIREQIKKETGFEVVFKGDGTSVHKMSSTDQIFRANVLSGRLENNQAIEEAKKWARERGITIYRTGIKQQQADVMMEVHFISPEVARNHATDLEELSYRIGMPVTFALNPKQNEIIRITTECIPESWELTKNPSIHIDKSVVTVKVTGAPSDEEIKVISDKIKLLTGYSLEVM